MLDHQGILVAYSKSIRRTVENINAIFNWLKENNGNKKCPYSFTLLIAYARQKPRDFSAAQLPIVYTCDGHGFQTRACNTYYEFVFKLKPPQYHEKLQ